LYRRIPLEFYGVTIDDVSTIFPANGPLCW
jgi:hypothetical protein